MEGKIKVALIHSNRIFRDALAFVLSRQQNIAVVGEVTESSNQWC